MMKRIYLIDDDKDFRDLFSMYIEDNYKDISFMSFPSGEEFLIYVKEEDIMPDAIICDYEMPGSNGVDVYFKLKNKNFLNHTKFFILSAYITFGAYDIQGAMFLSKKKSLKETINKILEAL